MGLQQTFIQNLKFYRKQKNLSQKDLSILLDKGFNYINSIEGGVIFPPPAVIDQIAGFLGIDAEVLFYNPENHGTKVSDKFKKDLEYALSDQILKDIQNICMRL